MRVYKDQDLRLPGPEFFRYPEPQPNKNNNSAHFYLRLALQSSQYFVVLNGISDPNYADVCVAGARVTSY